MRFWLGPILSVLVVLSGCTSIGYYYQLAEGQIALSRAARPIAKIAQDPSADPALKLRLQMALSARQWAVTALALPDNLSYSRYAPLGRPFTLWNVFATPELSVDGIEHCFPIAGCVNYRGYFRQADAEAEAARLAAQGFDTFVAGALAYSTLGKLNDPIVSPLLRYDDARLVATIVHELAHQKLYVPGDTLFNESYASFVEDAGGAEWLSTQQGVVAAPRYAERDDQFQALVLQTRAALASAYKNAADDAERRAQKAEILARFSADYAALKASWGGWTGYDWFWQSPPNNAKLLPFGLYRQFVPAFAVLFERHGRDWRKFHAAAAELAALPANERLKQLQSLMPDSTHAPLPR